METTNDPTIVPLPRDEPVMTRASAKRRGTSLEKGNSKTQKSSEGDMMIIARAMWGRDNKKERCENTENRDFREFFGCGCVVATKIYDLLIGEDLLPIGGHLEHFLWALMFMKIYGKERNLCTLAGGVDKKTFRKWAWLFVVAIAYLEAEVVSKIVTN